MIENSLTGNHYTQIHNLIIITSQDHSNNVFSYIMDITFYCCHQYLTRIGSSISNDACRFIGFLFGLQIWLQICNRFFHYTCTLHYLRKEHLSTSKQITNHIHSIHQRTFDYV